MHLKVYLKRRSMVNIMGFILLLLENKSAFNEII